jgi:hypothetical protein
MTHSPASATRVLALDPIYRGVGFAVLEGPDRLIDWGIKRTASRNPNARAIAAVVKLLRWYAPEVVVLQNCATRCARRRDRVRRLVSDLGDLAIRFHARPVHVAWSRVRRHCGGSPDATKEEIAQRLATRFPELARVLPPHRKPWMTLDARLGMFGAVALALNYYASPHRRPPEHTQA